MYILLAILLFSFLILIHELGHFVTAKLCNVQVNEFALFMGPVIFKKQVGETQYSLRSIPIGGFCAMEGEDEQSDNPRAFGRAVWWKRLLILLAGVAMNFLVGFLLMTLVNAPGESYVVPVISGYEQGSTLIGDDALQVGDRILELDGEKIYVQSDFSMILSLNPGQFHQVVVERDGQRVELPSVEMVQQEFVQEDGTTALLYGVSFTMEEKTFLTTLKLGWLESVDAVRLVRLSLQMLFSGKAGLKDISGPVGIVNQINQTVKTSGSSYVAMMNMAFFGGFLAINLAVMNLLPIPALDGGRSFCLLLTTAVEAVTKKKINPKYEAYLNGVGMFLLLGFMAVISFKDIFSIVLNLFKR